MYQLLHGYLNSTCSSYIVHFKQASNLAHKRAQLNKAIKINIIPLLVRMSKFFQDLLHSIRPKIKATVAERLPYLIDI